MLVCNDDQSRITIVIQIRVDSRSYQLGSWKGTGFTGPSSLGRGQRPYLAAGVCRDDGTEIGFDTGRASVLATNSV